MSSSVRVLRKRFLTKEEKDAWTKIQKEKRQEEIRRDRKKARKAKKERELKKRRAKELMNDNLQQCQPEFRVLVEKWAEDKSVAKVNRFFRLLKEVHCPVEPCYNTKLLEPVQRVLRLNKCGYKELINGMYLYDAVLCDDWEWEKVYKKECDRAHDLHSMLSEMA